MWLSISKGATCQRTQFWVMGFKVKISQNVVPRLIWDSHILQSSILHIPVVDFVTACHLSPSWTYSAIEYVTQHNNKVPLVRGLNFELWGFKVKISQNMVPRLIWDSHILEFSTLTLHFAWRIWCKNAIKMDFWIQLYTTTYPRL